MGRTKTIGDDEILRRARDVFRAGGHAASTREVARAVGISQAVLYQRFGSKEELFARAMHPDPPDLAWLLGPYAPADARTDLAGIAGRLAGYLTELMPTLIHVLAHPGLSRERMLAIHERHAFRPLLLALAERFHRLRDDGLIRAVDPALAAQTFVAVVHSAVLFHAQAHGGGPKGGEDAHVGALLDVLWTGLAPPGDRA